MPHISTLNPCFWLCGIIALCGILAGCNLTQFTNPPLPEATTDVSVVTNTPSSPQPTTTATPTATLTPTTPLNWTDELGVMRGICFESAFDAVGQTFILGNADDLTNFFNLADNSTLCRWPVERGEFNFADGRVLVGHWSYGFGCTARHDVISAIRDNATRTIDIRLRFVTEGDCPYELVRPFWVGIPNAADYAITLTVE